MHVFRLFEPDGISEDQFRWWYEDIEERSMQCATLSGDDEPCQNQCDYLIAFDIEATRSGYPSVLGRNCDIEILCWGGHSDETTEIAYCAECAQEQWQVQTAAKQARDEEATKTARDLQRLQLADAALRRSSIEHWRNLTALPFEIECAKLFRAMGFQAAITTRTNDSNIDIKLERDGKRGAAQCKAWSSPCGVSVVREFLGTIHAEELQFGYLIAKSGFTVRANALLQRLERIEAWDVDKLVEFSQATGVPSTLG